MKVTLALTPQERQIFLKELDQHLNDIESSLVNLEQNIDRDGSIEQLFRSFHTIKGNAGIADFPLLKNFSHEIENVLSKFRNNAAILPEKLPDMLFKALDGIKAMRNAIVDPKKDFDENDIIAMTEAFKQVIPSVTPTSGAAAQAKTGTLPTDSGFEVYIRSDDALPAVRLFQIVKHLEEKKISFESIPSLSAIETADIELPLRIYMPPDLVQTHKEGFIDYIRSLEGILATKVLHPLKSYNKTSDEEASTTKKSLAPTVVEELQEVQINIRKLDSLINLLGEILIDRNKIAKNIIRLEEKYTLDPHVIELLDLVNHLGQITYNLQTELLNIRTIPLSNIVEKYPRLIRELARQLGKKVRLEITGQHVELDRMILRYLNDMMIHLIRNAIDHGIEEPEDRLKKKKKEIGLIKIDAYQKHNKAFFVITDDGKGIDPAAIKKSLLKKKLVDEQTLDTLSNAEIIKYIFHPGFSTKETVSEISGRGVGMDVVQNTIQKLGGQISVESKLGEGSVFRITLPLTLAIIHGLVTQCHQRTFIIPISYVDEVVRTSGKDIRIVNQQPHIVLRDNLIPIINLKQLLYGKELNMKSQKKLFIVIVNYNDQQTGLLVDKLLGEEEIVIKNIDYAADKYYIIHSATIMGTGDIGLILDIGSLLDFVTMKKDKEEETESVHENTSR